MKGEEKMGEFLRFVSREEIYKEYILRLNAVSEIEKLNVLNTFNRVSSKNIISNEDLPGFFRANVDGYALKAEETFGASSEMPAFFKIKGEIKIGEEPSMKLETQEAVKVSTGGTIPQGANAVVMVENTQEVEDFVEVYKTISPWENVLKADEDIKSGEIIVEKGKKITHKDIHNLLALGVTEIEVFRKVKIGIISTGDEIIEPWETKVSKYHVRDSNTYFLLTYLQNLGFEAVRLGHVSDNYAELLKNVENALNDFDIIITCGGSSLGVRDYTMKVFSEVGKVVYHGALIKPGKPTVFGLSGNKVLLGLPGNPASFVSSTILFLLPILRKLSGEIDVLPKPDFYVKLDTNVPATQGRERFVHVRLYRKNHEVFANPVLGDSGLVSLVRKSDGMVRIPLGVEGVYKGELCEFYRF